MLKQILPFLFILALFVSCNNKNKLNSNEKELSKQILTEEEQLAEEAAQRAVHEKQLADSIAKLPKGFQFKESRHEDASNPPIILDFNSARNNVKPLKVSDLFSEIKYIKIDPDPDSLFYDSRFLISNKFIYAYSMNGIAQYSLDGHFIKYICKNESYYTPYKGGVMVTSEQAARFVGAGYPKLFHDKLYYRYDDRPENFAVFMEFDESSNIQSLNLSNGPESKRNVRGLGKQIMNLPQNNKSYRVLEMNPLGSGMIGFVNNRKINNSKVNFYTITSTSGDTICSFDDYDPIENYSKSIGRGAEGGYNYYFNGILHLRQVYNDTIYEVLPPNKMVPKYIFDFGDFGIKSSLEGVDPGYSLANKYVPGDFLESNRYLFFTYTKDYSCPATARSGSLKYSRLVYFKKSNELRYVYTDASPLVIENTAVASAPTFTIENDIDGSPFLWPQSVTSSGSPYVSVTGKLLKSRFETEKFGPYILNDNDCVIAIYK